MKLPGLQGLVSCNYLKDFCHAAVECWFQILISWSATVLVGPAYVAKIEALGWIFLCRGAGSFCSAIVTNWILLFSYFGMSLVRKQSRNRNRNRNGHIPWHVWSIIGIRIEGKFKYQGSMRIGFGEVRVFSSSHRIGMEMGLQSNGWNWSYSFLFSCSLLGHPAQAILTRWSYGTWWKLLHCGWWRFPVVEVSKCMSGIMSNTTFACLLKVYILLSRMRY